MTKASFTLWKLSIFFFFWGGVKSHQCDIWAQFYHSVTPYWIIVVLLDIERGASYAGYKEGFHLSMGVCKWREEIMFISQ